MNKKIETAILNSLPCDLDKSKVTVEATVLSADDVITLIQSFVALYNNPAKCNKLKLTKDGCIKLIEGAITNYHSVQIH